MYLFKLTVLPPLKALVCKEPDTVCRGAKGGYEGLHAKMFSTCGWTGG